MTLFNVKSQQFETRVPGAADFEKNCKKLSPKDLKAIETRITELVDTEMRKRKDRYLLLAKITGTHWGETPFQAIYDNLKCTKKDAAIFAGQFLIDIMIQREERWCFIPAEKNGDDYIARRYFMSEDR